MDQIKQIQQAISDYFNIPINLFYSESQEREIVWCRQFTWLFAKREMKYSLRNCGDIYDKDHATALHGIKRIKNLIDVDRPVKLAYEEINKEILCIFNPDLRLTAGHKVVKEIDTQIDALVNRFIGNQLSDEIYSIIHQLKQINKARFILTGMGELQTKVIV